MAAEEDKKFDAVLGGFLVNDLRIRSRYLHCPESDTLAAYHERTLLPEDMNSWKEHIVGCERCQAILAELEATDSVPLQVAEKEEVLAAATAPVLAASKTSPVHEAPAALRAKSGVTPISRPVRWQWLVPAGAIAAGLLVWVAWHENRSQLNAPTEIKTAKLEPAAAPPPPVTRDDRQAFSADENARASKDQAAIGGAAAPTKPGPESRSLKQLEKSDLPRRVSSSEPQADKQAGALADTTLDSLAASNRAQGQPAQDAKAGVVGAMSQTVEVQTPAANAHLQNQQVQQNQLSEQKSSGPNPSSHLEKKSKAVSPPLTYRAAAAQSAAPPPPVPAPAAAFGENGRATSAPMAGGLVPHLISTAGAKSLWRVGPMGMIEFSIDGGASWARQISNVSVELTGGSAPSEKVCWVVGRAGTILLTTDAGAHWTTVHSPLAEDLGGVRATDARHATIWNLDNTKTLETSDGGLTWKPAVPQ